MWWVDLCKGWAALSSTLPCIDFAYKDYCGSVGLAMLESEGLKRQVDWQGQQTLHLVCSLAGQRCIETWSHFWTWTDQSITTLITLRREQYRKELTFHPLRSVAIFVQPDQHCFKRNIGRLFRDGAECTSTIPSTMMPFWAESEYWSLSVVTVYRYTVR